ncbi:MAG: phosphonoacetate hydrolase [Actinobacteria bacterium]|nr:phosphonoacetate hydrolase [Actinomycetota bacterium]
MGASDAPLVVICADGTAPEYLDAAVDHGRMPAFERMRRDGTYALARSALPSFTNPNNVTIVTGQPPAVHGVSGNYFYDEERDAEVMMDRPAFLRCSTLLARFALRGRRVAAITAKDKLRTILGAGWRGICFSGELADSTTEAEHGIADIPARLGRPKPGMYSGQMSDYVMACGVYLVQQHLADVVYVSLTDYVQHTYAPGTPEADAFYAALDVHLAELDALGAIIVLTADHGMNDKCGPDGSPNVVYLETVLRDHVPGPVRVILPITDPHVTHHACLGSCASVYLPQAQIPTALQRLKDEHNIDAAIPRMEAAAAYELPADRIGDIVVLSNRSSVLGGHPDAHDLSQLHGARLRSHGGLHEATVPFAVNRRLKPAFEERVAQLRNADAFPVGSDGVVA